jgi:hypothetical protein
LVTFPLRKPFGKWEGAGGIGGGGGPMQSKIFTIGKKALNPFELLINLKLVFYASKARITKMFK